MNEFLFFFVIAPLFITVALWALAALVKWAQKAMQRKRQPRRLS